MDDGGHNRENGRDKTDQYKSLHSPWMLSQHQMKDSNTFRLMAIVAERDKVIQERNLALSEKKTALAHRDMAILQRDAANAERDTAIMERDNAMAALEYARENGMNGNNRSGCPPGCTALHVTKHINHNPRQQPPPQQQLQHAQAQQQQTSEATYNMREMHTPEAFSISTVSEGAAKGRKEKRPKEGKVQPSPSKKTSKSPKKSKKGGGEDLNRQAKIPKSQGEWMGEVEGGEDLNKQLSSTKHHEWKLPDLGLNQVTYDESMMPIPVCSCTGKDRQCYKWGNGGWQSACCTMTLSMYPLPVMPNKRHARVGGRKMSGNVFNRLLSRLAAEGHDLSTALDLKDHWAKHGTNRYITVK